MICSKILNALAADKRRQPQLFSPTDLAGLKLQSLRERQFTMNIDDIAYQIRGAAFEVNRVLGHGFLEKVYEKALMIELSSRGLSVENQVAA